MQASSDSAEHGRAEKDRFRGFGSGDHEARGIRQKLAHQRALACTATDDDGVRPDALCGLRLDNLSEAVSETAYARNIEPDESGDGCVHIEARNDGLCFRVGKRCTVAEKFRHHMQTVCQP